MAGVIGYGWKLQNDAAVANTYVDIADVISVTSPGLEVSKVDVSTITQATAVKQYIPGMREGGTLSFEVLWSAATYSSLMGFAGDVCNYRLKSNEGSPTNYTWTGFVTKVGEMTVQGDGAVTCKVEVQVNSVVTIS